MKEWHYSKWAGYPGMHRTLALLEERYYWPHMGADVETYVELKTPAGLLQPLPVPKRPWESLSMDFIIGLPKFSKYATFISVTNECPAEEAARLFLRHVFWTELFNIHPQTDGQTERVNALLEAYLRHYVSATQRNWSKFGATNQSPFEIVTGQQPLTPNAVVTHCTGPNPAAYRFAKYWQGKNDLARACLHKANKCSKKWAGKKRRDVQFQVGASVLAKLHLILRYTGLHMGLVRRYEGPFKVVKRVGKVAYKLELPAKLKVYPAFHISMLKPFYEDKEDPNRGKFERAPMGVKVSYDREVKNIEVDRVIRQKYHRPRHEYLVRWKGLPDSEASWEPAEAL
ncbi:hypothetical protein V6Z11_D04G064600 [Gossypium hirsutum]